MESSLPRAFVQRYPDLHLFGTAPGPQNNVIGIFSVDLSLNWLTELIDSVKPYEDSYSIIVNREGRYILHPGNDFFTDLDKDILHEAEILQDTNASKLAHLMMQGQKGKGVFVNNHVKYY